MTDPRRAIPSVETLLASEALRGAVARAGRPRVVALVRRVQEDVRRALSEAGATGATLPDLPSPVNDPEWYAGRVLQALEDEAVSSLRGVINATGVVLHTNLGRAPLAAAARRAVQEVAGYATLEYDLETGRRGARHTHAAGLLRELTGAESALVVNNNAAAVVLALNTLAEGRPVVISRGELVEIGGSFRVPEIMARSGAVMREVGATNRTHARDYRAALDEGAALVLKVHRSNFRLEGFTAEVDAAELANLAASAGVPLLHDLGSGALLDLTPLGLPSEPTAGDALEAGADVVTMSGDKLLGGPQCGILLGRQPLLERMRSNPLYRAFRPGKLTLAALDATLRLYRDPDDAVRSIPTLRMLALSRDTLRERATSLAARLADRGRSAEPVPTSAAVGGGAYPGVELPSFAVAVQHARGAEWLAGRLRDGAPPVIGRIRDDAFLLDLRTVPPEREAELIAALEAVSEGAP